MTEMDRIHLVLFEMNNRIFGPYLTAIDGILISVMHVHNAKQHRVVLRTWDQS
jgi:hypothetical protein